MSKSNKRILIILFIIISFFVVSQYIIVNRRDIILNYNEKDYKHTQFIVDVEGYQSLSGYYLINEEYYKNNKSMSKKWIEEDVKIKSSGNQYCKPRIDILKSIQNLETTKNIPKSSTPDMSMDFVIQKDKVFDKDSWNYYEGQVSIYLKDNVISIDRFGFKGDKDNIFKKTKYYIIDDNVKENTDKILEQVINEKL